MAGIFDDVVFGAIVDLHLLTIKFIFRFSALQFHGKNIYSNNYFVWHICHHFTSVFIVVWHLAFHISIFFSQNTRIIEARLDRNITWIAHNISYDVCVIQKFKMAAKPFILSDLMKFQISSSQLPHVCWNCYMGLLITLWFCWLGINWWPPLQDRVIIKYIL